MCSSDLWYNEEIGYQAVYELNTNTAFNHEAYATQFDKELSQLLDFIPVIGGVKAFFEGLTGITMTGELLTEEQKNLSMVMGVLSVALDLWTLGTLTATMTVTKALISSTVRSIGFGYAGKFVVEKLMNMGFTPLQAFVINLFGTIVLVGMMKRIVKNVSGPKTASPYDLEPTHGLPDSKNEFNKFVNQVKENGITETVKYVEHDGVKYIVDGHHRIRAAKILGITDVPIEQVQLPYKGYNTVLDLIWYGE